MTNNLIWKRDAILDTYTSEAAGHRFFSMRTWIDVAVLYHNGIEIRRSGSDGSHKNNIAFAEKIFAEQTKSLSEVADK
jgi:hypothetical protein